eukprot:403373493
MENKVEDIQESFELINTYINKQMTFGNDEQQNKQQNQPKNNSETNQSKKRTRDDFEGVSRLCFDCKCGLEITDLKQLPDHMKACTKMSQKYQKFYQEWEKCVDSAVEQDQIAQWRNMRALYLMFEQKFNDFKKSSYNLRKSHGGQQNLQDSQKEKAQEDGPLIQQGIKRLKTQQEQPKIIAAANNDIDVLMNAELSEQQDLDSKLSDQIKGKQANQKIKQQNVQQKMDQEEEKVSYNQQINQDQKMEIDYYPIREEEQMKCGSCQSVMNDKNFEEFIFLEKCCHCICKSCIKIASEKQFPEVKCPQLDCNQFLMEFELRQVLGDKVFDDLQQTSVKKFLSEEMDLIKCKCGNMIEVTQGDVCMVKKDDGKSITKVAALHMSKFRVRCPDCGNNFCIKCGEEPYHLGMNCEQHNKNKMAPKCRFCKAVLKNDKQNFCTKQECSQKSWNICKAFNPCGHPCYGSSNEQVHPPCLHEDCVSKNEDLTLGENSDSFCVICYISGLGEAAVIQLKCKHIFHQSCFSYRIYGQPQGLAISFKQFKCPSCNQHAEIDEQQHHDIYQILVQEKELERKVREKCVKRAEHEGLQHDERLKDPKNEYFNNLEAFAFDHLNYYKCYTCHNPFFGGLKQCDQNPNLQGGAAADGAQGNNVVIQQNNNHHDLQCSKCKFFSNDKTQKYGITYCQVKGHGQTYIQYKCNYCCNIAAYHCGGQDYYCMRCHDGSGPIGPMCSGPDDCPLRLEHPPNKSNKSFAVGCGMCKELKIKDGKDGEADLKKQIDKQMKKFVDKKNKDKDQFMDF